MNLSNSSGSLWETTSRQPSLTTLSLIGRTPCQPQGSTPLHMVSSRTTEMFASSISSLAPHSASNSSSGRSGETKAKYLQGMPYAAPRSEEHTSELQSLRHLVCRLLLEKKKHRALRRMRAEPRRPSEE